MMTIGVNIAFVIGILLAVSTLAWRTFDRLISRASESWEWWK